MLWEDYKLVENQGFEPWEALTPRRISNPVHSTNSANSPYFTRLYCCCLEAPPRFELGIEALQAPALPLGDGAIRSVNQL